MLPVPLRLQMIYLMWLFNEPLVHQVVTAYFAGSRSGTKAQKHVRKFLEVVLSLGNKKVQVVLAQVPFVQPIWRGGGVSFAAKPA